MVCLAHQMQVFLWTVHILLHMLEVSSVGVPPGGWYGVPQTVYGCPWRWWRSLVDLRFDGFDFQKQRYRAPDVAGPLVGETLTLGVCVSAGVALGAEGEGQMFPAGRYCVYQIGDTCPQGLSPASFQIAGSRIRVNSVVDPSPLLSGQPSDDGAGRDVMVVGLCCRDDGDVNMAADIGLQAPFFLFKVGATCQVVSGMRAQSQNVPLPVLNEVTYGVSGLLTEAVRWFGEKPALPFCFYDDYACPQGKSSLNTTAKCAPDTDRAQVNAGAATMPDAREAGPGYPATQRTEPPYRQEALQALDDDPETCTTHFTLSTPWWQMDLRQAEQVTAFTVYTAASGSPDCFPEEATVYVSMRKDDFLADSAPVCARNYTGSGNLEMVPCKRALIGRFVTMVQGSGARCLSICEFKIFIKESFCGLPLGVADVSLTRDVITSSNMAERSPADVGIFSTNAWCATPDDPEPYIQIDLTSTRAVTGLVTQGGEDPDTDVTALTFTLTYGTSPSGVQVNYEEQYGVPKVFQMGADPHSPKDHILARPILARIVRLVVRTWIVRPCIRVQLVGCRDRQEPLAVKSANAPDLDLDAGGVVDGVTDTCVTFNTSHGVTPSLVLTLEEGAVPQHLEVAIHPYDDSQQALTTCLLTGSKGQGGSGNAWRERAGDGTCAVDAEMGSGSLLVEVVTWGPRGRNETGNVRKSVAPPGGTACGEVGDNRGCLRQLIVFGADSNTTVCEVAVYGYTKVPEISLGPTTTTLSCSAGTYIRVVNMTLTSSVTTSVSDVTGGTLLVTRRAFVTLPLICPTDGSTCVLPASGTGSTRVVDAAGSGVTVGSGAQQQTLMVQFACIHLTSPGASCHNDVTEPGVVMTTSNYLSQYGREFSCTWSVITSRGGFPQINVRQYKLEQSETMFYSGRFLVDPGSCRDQLWVQYAQDGTGDRTGHPWIPVDGPQTYLAPGSKVNLKLVTCLRVKVTQVEAPRLYVDYELAECPGCGVGMRAVGMTTCRAPCGIVTSLGYPGGYKPKLSLTWKITVAHRTYVSFTFTSFDVISDDAKCRQDRVIGIFECGHCIDGTFPNILKNTLSVDDLDRTATRLINIGTFCNPKPPPEALYGDWENIQILFLSNDDVTTGAGFSAVYRTLYYFFPTDLQWIQNDSVCPTTWDSYSGSCYGFVETPDDVTWLEADDICQGHGARLASVKDMREMIFINFLLIQYFDGADLYIGASDRLQEGRYVWHDDTPLTYTHWRKGRPDGASIEDCAGLDLDSLRFKPSWVDWPCNSREANHFVCKKNRGQPVIELLDLTTVTSRRARCPSGTLTCGSGACVHGVRQCDGIQDCDDGSDEKSCGPPCPTFSFDCGNNLCRPLSAVCDGRWDCPDGEDERDCVFPVCSAAEFRCEVGPCIDARWHCDLMEHCHDGSDEQQCGGKGYDTCSPELTFQCYDSSCIPASRRCDGTVDCPGGHKEDEGGCGRAVSSGSQMKCKNTQMTSQDRKCLYDTDRFGLLEGCRDAKHLEDCGDFVCPSNYVKCPSSYCLAVHKVCDGNPDCPHGEDELRCQNYTCPGMLRCRGYSNCVPRERICDGDVQCFHGDDELFCDVMNDACRAYYQCQCGTLVYACVKARLKGIPWYILEDARKLNLTGNKISLRQNTFSSFHYLIELVLVDNSIEAIRCCYFEKLVNLKLLDLAYNRLTDLFADAFRGLGNLQELVLLGNPVFTIQPGSFRGLSSMRRLSLYGLSVRQVKAGTFDGLVNVVDLDLSANTMQELQDDAFSGLPMLRRLNISRNVLTIFNGRDFQGLTHLDYLESDNEIFCCFVTLPEESCLPKPDAVSSCEDLLSRDVLRTFLWLLGVLSLVGNCAVLVYRCAKRQTKLIASELLICHLAGADFLMGVYLISMACADAYFRGNYVENATWWKGSWGCSILGMIACVSAEMSVITVFVITMDRVHRVKFPMSSRHLTTRSASLVMAMVWTLVTFLFLVPILPNSYFRSAFYSRSGVCVPIHITPEPAPGWQYSVLIFHGLNMTLFTLMCVAYGSIYWTVRQMKGKKNRDMQRARKMASIVFADFCCWVPINTMGMLALAGVEVPGEMYAWTVVFILPINSSLNPILYTLSTINLPGRGKKPADSSTADITSRWLGRRIQVRLSSAKEDSKSRHVTLDDFVRTQNEAMNDVTVLYRMFYQVAVLLDHLHADRICLGELTMTNIELDMDDSLRASCLSWPDVSRVADKAAVADDLTEYGQLMAHVLRAYLMKKARAPNTSQA